jgi:hypothetical protein
MWQGYLRYATRVRIGRSDDVLQAVHDEERNPVTLMQVPKVQESGVRYVTAEGFQGRIPTILILTRQEGENRGTWHITRACNTRFSKGMYHI